MNQFRQGDLLVTPTVKTCKEGKAWTFGFEEKDFNPIKET